MPPFIMIIIANTVFNWSNENVLRVNEPVTILEALGCASLTKSSVELSHFFLSMQVCDCTDDPLRVVSLSHLRYLPKSKVYSGSLADWLYLMSLSERFEIAQYMRGYFRDNGLKQIL